MNNVILRRIRRRISWSWLCVCLLFLPSIMQSQTSANDRDKQELIRLHHEFTQQYGNHDSRAIEFYRHDVCDPLIFLHSDGQIETMNLQQSIDEDRKEYETNPRRRVHLQAQDVGVHAFGNTAIVTSRFTASVTGSKNAKENIQVEGTQMQTWIRESGQWKLAAISSVANPNSAQPK